MYVKKQKNNLLKLLFSRKHSLMTGYFIYLFISLKNGTENYETVLYL